jgi:DNA-binding MarR family transcriptional regulator
MSPPGRPKGASSRTATREGAARGAAGDPTVDLVETRSAAGSPTRTTAVATRASRDKSLVSIVGPDVAPRPRESVPPTKRAARAADPSAAAREADDKPVKPLQKLDQSALRHVLGYHLSLADVPSKRLFFRYIGEPLKLRPVEFSLLVLVRDNREATQKQLGQALSLAAPNLTLLLDKLEERGLITRERSLQDRRAQHVRLTPAGDQLARAGHEASFAMEREWTRALSEAERAMLAELLRKMARLGPA